MLKQFDDLLVKILIAAAIVSFLLAIVNGDTGLSAFVEPTVSVNFLFYVLYILFGTKSQICEKRPVIVYVASCRSSY